MPPKSTKKKRTSNKKKIGDDCNKDSECFTNYCYQNKCTSKTRSYEIIEQLNKELKEHYDNLRKAKEERVKLNELLDDDNNNDEQNIEFIYLIEKTNEIIEKIKESIQNVQEQLKDDSSTKKSAAKLSSQRDLKKKQTYECPICMDTIDDINNSINCKGLCKSYFHNDCVKEWCKQATQTQRYDYGVETDEVTGQRFNTYTTFNTTQKCPVCKFDWTSICNEVTSSSSIKSDSSGETINLNASDDSSISIYGIDDDDSSIGELAEIFDVTRIHDDLDAWRRNTDSPPWSSIPLDDPRNQLFHTNSPPSTPPGPSGGKKKKRKINRKKTRKSKKPKRSKKSLIKSKTKKGKK